MTSAITKLATVTADGTSSSIDFTGFSSAYDDLIIKVNVRSSRNSGPIQDGLNIKFNSLGGTNYAYQYMFCDAGAAQGDAANNTNLIFAGYIPSANASANIFSSAEIYISDYKDTTHNKAVKANVVGENDGSQAYMTFCAGSFLNTSAITTISLLTGSGQNWISGSTAILYGVTKPSVGGSGSKATGGTVTTSGGYTYHTFLTSGIFTPTSNISNAEVLLIAGGGSGGGGGGGAGGLRYFSGQSFTAGTAVTAIIGAGGTGVTGNSNGNSGMNSYFGTNSATGGGAGNGGTGSSGGSGGGGGGSSSATYAGGSGNAGGYTPVEGYAGGSNGGQYAAPYPTGGGGGAGSAGQNAPYANVAGKGGDGSSSYSAWATATNTGDRGYYAGGGGGCNYNGGGTPGTGGLGGGGQGGTNYFTVTPGRPNTGGGGGATPNGNTATPLPNGGSGIVIVRYTT